jgi:tRNA-splicing endonuclease subunit Sen54
MRGSRLGLLPEEALFLLERGSLDVRWVRRRGRTSSSSGTAVGVDSDGNNDEEDEGIPMSLQAAYAAFIGDGPGKVGLEQYLVYAGLKRAGYAVLRADDWQAEEQQRRHDALQHTSPQKPASLFHTLWRSLYLHLSQPRAGDTASGPLVKPGLYRSYGTHTLPHSTSCSLTFYHVSTLDTHTSKLANPTT